MLICTAVTILAFIFLPMNLASSTFGMNVKSISGDRTPLYAFFVTAVALMIGALCIWVGGSIFMRYHKLNRDLQEKLHNCRPEEIYGRSKRTYLFQEYGVMHKYEVVDEYGSYIRCKVRYYRSISRIKCSIMPAGGFYESEQQQLVYGHDRTL
jgi:hypothetical protein